MISYAVPTLRTLYHDCAVPVDEDIVQVKVEYEVDQLLLRLSVRLFSSNRTVVVREEAERVH